MANKCPRYSGCVCEKAGCQARVCWQQHHEPRRRTPSVSKDWAEVKQAAAQNKQALAHYSWQQQQETIAVKGDVKDTKV